MSLPLGTILDHPCPECGSKMVLRDSRYGLFYGCTGWPLCDAAHGAHKNSGEPLGIPADKETKKARMRAHEKFDLLWKRGHTTRSNAYVWMQKAMGLSAEEVHIGRFDEEQCEQLIERVEHALELYTDAAMDHLNDWEGLEP